MRHFQLSRRLATTPATQYITHCKEDASTRSVSKLCRAAKAAHLQYGAIKVWELCGADKERVFSPFCWATRLAVLHKGLKGETVPWWTCRPLTSSFCNSFCATVSTAKKCYKESFL